MKTIIWIVVVIAIFIALLYGLISYNETSVIKEYSLHELDDGIYGIYTVVSSSIPAQNYEIITLCVNGQGCTFKGHVHIYYTDVTPKLVWEDKNSINSDTMSIYVPYGSIEYSANVGIGSRR